MSEKLLLCSTCKEMKPTSEYTRHSKTKRGYQYNCRPCNTKSKREWVNRHPDNKEKDKLNTHKSFISRKYGITYSQYEDMLDAQSYACDVCGIDIDATGRLHFDIDHDHDTGKVRGLLCHKCNKGLGCFDDDTQKLKYAIEYLEKHKGLANGDMI